MPLPTTATTARIAQGIADHPSTDTGETMEIDLHKQAFSVNEHIRAGYTFLGLEEDSAGVSTCVILSSRNGKIALRIYSDGSAGTIRTGTADGRRDMTAAEWHRSHYPHRYGLKV